MQLATRPWTPFVPAVVTWIMMTGCGEPTAAVECTDESVVISVTDAPVPAFSWAPACGMASLAVRPTAGDAGGWVIYTGVNAAANPLRSGIRYGNAPPVAVEPAPAAPLVHGITYTVSVSRAIADGHGGVVLLIAGSANFQE